MYIERYYDEFCCDDVELVIDGEIVDTDGGDYTYRDTYICKTCKKVFYSYSGCGRFEGIEKETDQEEIDYLFSQYGTD